MTGLEAIGGIGSIGLGTLIGWIFRSGRLAERLQSAQDRAKKDADGIAKNLRDEKARAERRWKHELADRVEEAVTQKMRNRLASRIRQDAYRD